MNVRLTALSATACVGLTLFAAWLFEWPLEKAILLAPVIVVVAGATVGLVVLWWRVLWESLRRQPHPIRIVAIGVGAVALLVGLSLLGVKLPRE